jgi:hypothetical protein
VGADRLEGEHAERQVVRIATGSRLKDALEGEVGEGQAHLRRLVVRERRRQMPDLGQTLGEESPSVDAGGAVGQCGEHDHGITVIGHDEVKTVEREVRSDQRTVNLDTPQEMPGRRVRQASGGFRRHAVAASTCRQWPVDGRGQRLS